MRSMRGCGGVMARCAMVVVAVTAGAKAEDGAAVEAREAPAAAAPPQRKLAPLPPAPLLLEQALRGLLEATPGRETLDDVMRRAAARNRAAAAAAEAAQRRQFIRQQAQQFEQLFQPLLRVELALVQRCCTSLPPDARAKVLAASRQAVRELAERVARHQFEGEGASGPVDVRRALHGKMAALLEPLAARDEFAAYERESRLRQERRAAAARIKIVAKLDEQLGLTAAQRRDMLDDLANHWQAEWIRELEDHDGLLINDHPPAPDFAAARIVPHLDPVQRAQWDAWSEVAGWEAIPRGGVDWSDLNALQQGQQKQLDAWWKP